MDGALILKPLGIAIVVVAGVIMCVSAYRYWQLLGDFRAQVQTEKRRILFYVIFVMLVLFAASFFATAALLLTVFQPKPAFLLVEMILFFGAVFCRVVVANTASFVESLERKNRELHEMLETIREHNEFLKSEVDAQTSEITRFANLREVTNKVASRLIYAQPETFTDDCRECLKMLAASTEADRAYIWKNIEKDGQMFGFKIVEWAGDNACAAPSEGQYELNIPSWDAKLSADESINCPASALPEEEQKMLPKGILSLLVVPLFLDEKYWGSIGIDDYRRERDFSAAEERFLRTSGLLFAGALMKDQLNRSLIEAREAALAGAEAKGTFLANMSHEIRTPINAVIGMTAIARRSKEKDKIADCLEKVSAASNQLLGLINDILDMSKIEAGKLELSPAPFFLQAALENLRSIVGVKAAEKDIALKFEIAGLPEAVDADETRFSQVLLNLLSNAVKFTPDGGKVVLSAKAAKTDDPLIDEYEFAIADSGIGMSEEEKSRLFKPFQQADSGISRRFGGTGLGLALSLRIAELMGGGIAVESEPGKGSVFTARVKMKKADAAELSSIKKGSEAANYDFSGKTVLVAEDIEINREIVAGMLDGTGIAVVSAHNGKEAVEQFREAPDKFNLILMDMQMPEMDGLEATRQIRAIEEEIRRRCQLLAASKRTPIIAMTANAFNEDIERCLEAGMDDHIAKPVDMNLFLEMTAKYLGL